jgi:hypothetical protein
MYHRLTQLDPAVNSAAKLAIILADSAFTLPGLRTLVASAHTMLAALRYRPVRQHGPRQLCYGSRSSSQAVIAKPAARKSQPAWQTSLHALQA